MHIILTCHAFMRSFSVLVLLCCVLFFYFLCTGVRIHPEFETAEALAMACIVEFFFGYIPITVLT